MNGTNAAWNAKAAQPGEPFASGNKDAPITATAEATLYEKARDMARRALPAWRALPLDTVHVSEVSNILKFWYIRETGVLRRQPSTKRFRRHIAAFNRAKAFRGWRLHTRFGLELDEKLVREVDNAPAFSERHAILTRDLDFNSGVMLVEAPDGGAFATVYVMHAHSNKGVRFYVYPRGGRRALVAFHNEDVRVSNAMAAAMGDREPNSRINVHNTTYYEHLDDAMDWDRIVLPEGAAESLRRDFTFFLENRAWYRRNNLPHRRGYLLHGPPGNGKTCVVRALARTVGITAYSFDFGRADNAGNDELQAMFRAASRNTPSLVVFEDLDRVFEKNSAARITKEFFLNRLDGVESMDGVAVIATANHPDWLGGALANRPGRFDRVIHLPAPTMEVRQRYFACRFKESADVAVTAGVLDRLARDTDGLMLAHLNELFVRSAAIATLDGRLRIEDADALAALKELVDANRGAASGRRIGFGGQRQTA